MEEEKEKEDPLKNDDLFLFLEKATIATEKALQQNESVDIFNETFRIVGACVTRIINVYGVYVLRTVLYMCYY